MEKYRNGARAAPANYAPLTPISFLERSAGVYPENRRSSTRTPHFLPGYVRPLVAAPRCFAQGGCQTDDTVSVFAPNSVAMLEMHFAARWAGAVLNAINFASMAQLSLHPGTCRDQVFCSTSSWAQSPAPRWNR